MKFFLVLVLLMATLSLYASDEVQLIKATGYMTGHYGIPEQHREIIIRVKNLGYNKTIVAHAAFEDGTWSAGAEASYIGQADAGYEIWKIRESHSKYVYGGRRMDNGSWTGEFVLKYEVNGNEYWDNNNSENYFVEPHGGVMFPENDVNVTLVSASHYSSNGPFQGYIDVRDIAYNKEIKVHYTTDGWNTVGSASATWMSFYSVAYGGFSQPGAHNGQRWYFWTNVNTGECIEFVVSYTADGNTYWDNNYGRNFRACN